MDFRILLYAVIILFGLFLGLFCSNNDKIRSLYIDVVVLLLILESALRSVFVGSDTYTYYELFHQAGNTPWKVIMSDFVDRYIHFNSDQDVGYQIYEKILFSISDGFNFFLLISALLYFLPLRAMLKRYSYSIWGLMLGFVFYVALLNVTALSGIRQQIALGCSIMAFLRWEDEKYFRMAVWVLAGFLIHMTMLFFVFIPLLQLVGKEKLKKIHLMMFVFVPVVIIYAGDILINMADTVGNEHYKVYGELSDKGGSVTFVVLMETFSLFSYFSFKKMRIEDDRLLNDLYVMLPLITLFCPLINHHGSMIRISQFFHVYLVIILSYSIDMFFKNNKIKTIVYVFSIATLLFLSLSQPFMYHFYWQDLY